MDPLCLIIDGKKVPTTRCFEVLNPATEKVAGLAPLGTPDHLEDAIRAARIAYKSWREETERKRQTACKKIAQKLESHAEELAQLLTAEQGKPLNGMGSRWEVGGAVAWTEYTSTLTLPAKVLQDGPPGRVELHRKPIGVVGSITPWNYPLLIAVWHIIPAILAGNTVVIKPSPYTPLTTLRAVELMNEVLPRGVVNCVSGDDDLGPILSSHPAIDKIVFTGSIPTGKHIYSSAASTMKRLTLELGGNDAGIVLADVNPKEIAESLFWGAFLNSGQTCAALKRLYVHDDVYEDLCEELVRFARKMPMGIGTDESVMLGPVQNLRQYKIVNRLVEEAKEAGGRVLLGANPQTSDTKKKGFFYPVTLIADVSDGIRLVDNEQFGPALPIIRYRDIEDAIRRANASDNGLGGSVWGRDLVEARRVASKLECGSVWINRHGMIQPNAPFGGVKQSGIGVEFGQEGLFANTDIQVVFL
jgi:acyl-CoA reductase-like NAD-dependent aldehyde dehydrogenase